MNQVVQKDKGWQEYNLKINSLILELLEAHQRDMGHALPKTYDGK